MLHFLLAHFNSFLIKNYFSSSSVNAKQKFSDVPHLLHMCLIFRQGVHLYMSLFPSVCLSICLSVCLSVCLSICPSVCRAPYLKNGTSSNNNFWYTHVKWYLLVFCSFFLNVYFLGCYGYKRAKNSPKWIITITSVTCHISGIV